MMDFTEAELDLLIGDGFEPGYMGDIQLNDLVAIPPVMRYNFEKEDKKVATVVVTRIVRTPRYNDGHQVMVFIGTDLDGRPHHLTYGETYPCFIKKEA